MIKRLFRISAYLTALFVFFFILKSFTPQQDFSLLIKDGFILDGTGNPWFKGDIGINGKKIAEIGNLSNKKAGKTIDASGLVISPGFIDVHTHCDREIIEVPTVDNYILQGVTTVVGGNCGGHSYPIADLFLKLEENGMSINFGCLVGHNTIRREVMELKMEPPTAHELDRMKALIRQEMEAGALGFSTGLSYLPGVYSDMTELVFLASAIVPFGGIYISHIRDQGKKITQAIQEAIEVGEKNNIPVLISHIKLAEDTVWGKPEMITLPVEKARERGVEVFLDQYPYSATSSGFTSSLPSWCFEGGREKFRERLEDKESYERIKSFVIERRLTSTKNIDKLKTIYIGSSREFAEFEGKNLREILIFQKKEPTIDNAADLIIKIEKNGGAKGIFFQMDETDIEYLMGLPYTIHASDGGVQVKGKGVPHPRNYGTFPRVIANYVRERGVITVEEAVRKMTSLPAQVFRLRERGMLREGMYADITVFDYNSFEDQATFTKPHQYGRGLRCVIVNGQIVVRNDTHTGKLPGMVIYGPGKKQEAENDSQD
ncbi:MAG: D-aminoacylase [Candidatus Aminicenantes bacterium]|nr:MAG: D-aminoacylase [Candidatus Aminicenantes bacterium]